MTHFSEKAIKLKQAKEEAKVEIAKFTKERESEFKVSESLMTHRYVTLGYDVINLGKRS